MAHTIVAFALTLGIAVTATAQERAKPPKRPPPEFVTVAAMDKAQAVLDLEYTVDVGVQHMRYQSHYEVNGEARTVEIITPKPIQKQRILKLKLKYAEVFDGRGMKLETEEAWKRLAVGASVVIPVDGEVVDSVYLRVLAKDALVIVSPQCATWRRNMPFHGSISESVYTGPTEAEKQLEELFKDLPPGG